MAEQSAPPAAGHSSPHRLTTAELGAAAETRAARFLEAHGLIVLARNLRCKAGELDLVCLDGEVLVIVEVRHRTRTDFGSASASVTAHKQRKLIRATRFFWQRQPGWRCRLLRFDVVALWGKPVAVTPRSDRARVTDAAPTNDTPQGIDTPHGIDTPQGLKAARGIEAAPHIEWIKDAFRVAR